MAVSVTEGDCSPAALSTVFYCGKEVQLSEEKTLRYVFSWEAGALTQAGRMKSRGCSTRLSVLGRCFPAQIQTVLAKGSDPSARVNGEGKPAERYNLPVKTSCL